jgi:alkaline phosphatase
MFRRALVCASLLWCCPRPGLADNIILLIGDGMGFAQLDAARLFDRGPTATLAMERLPVHGRVRTDSATDSPTDSAAAATAMATGRKVANDVVSLAIPGDGRPLPTILEMAQQAGWSTGMVTTSYLTHATPACFAAHATDRGHLREIARDYFERTRPDILLGGGHDELTTASLAAPDYTVVRNREELAALDDTAPRVAGLFGDGHMPYEVDGVGDLPHLHEMALAAIRFLEGRGENFFLMIEGGRIDHAGHSNQLPRNIGETLEFDRTIAAVADWARDREDTLIIVTADHETGGLEILGDLGIGQLPAYRWTTNKHTAVPIPVFASGPGANILKGTVDNTAIYAVMEQLLHRSTARQ